MDKRFKMLEIKYRNDSMKNVRLESSRVSPSTEATTELKRAIGITYFRILEPN